MKTEQKMYVTHAKTGRKVFCIVNGLPSGLVVVKFFVPKSIYISSPDLDDSVYFFKNMEQEDWKKKSTMLVYYLVHPSYMLGTSFPVLPENHKAAFEVAEELINQFELKS